MAVKLKSYEKFDIDSSYIKMSPCRNCIEKERLSECTNTCETINKIQKLLAGSISRSNNFSEKENYSLSQIYF